MRHVITMAVFTALALAAWADEKSDKTTKETTAKGSIVSIDHNPDRITVFTHNKEVKLRVTDDTKIRLEGKVVAFNRLQVGDPVSFRYERGDKGNRAIELNSDVATARELRKELKEAIRTAGSLAYREKEQYQKQMADVLRHLDAQLEKLMAQGKQLSADARNRYAKEIKKLNARRKAVAHELNQAGKATADTWEDLKKDTSIIVAELGDAIGKAFGENEAPDKDKNKVKE